MTWREIREADLPACLALQPGNLGDEIVGRETAVRIWKRLLGDRAFRGIMIEDCSAGSRCRIIGAGAGVFVRPDFIAAEIGNPRPGVKSRIVASLAHGGASVLLEHEQVGAANAGAGVDIVSLMGSWRQRSLSRDELGEMSGLLAESFFQVYRGYRLHRFLQEINGPEEMQALSESKIFRFIGRYPELGRATALLTKQDGSTVFLCDFDVPIRGARAAVARDRPAASARGAWRPHRRRTEHGSGRPYSEDQKALDLGFREDCPSEAAAVRGRSAGR
jgi:hypothetical protein